MFDRLQRTQFTKFGRVTVCDVFVDKMQLHRCDDCANLKRFMIIILSRCRAMPQLERQILHFLEIKMLYGVVGSAIPGLGPVRPVGPV